jgi:hypothetical protein
MEKKKLRELKIRKNLIKKRELDNLNKTKELPLIKRKPIINMDKLAAKAEDKLKHNEIILKALEKEYLKEYEGKDGLLEQLKKEGFSSLQEKVDFLKEKAILLANKINNKQI